VSPVKKAGHLPIYNRIGVLRAERRMSRAQLAELVGVNVQSIGSLERGDNYPSLDLAFRICEVFELPVEAVFSRHEFGAMSTQLYRGNGTSGNGTSGNGTSGNGTSGDGTSGDGTSGGGESGNRESRGAGPS
jgi:DNA-binding XRE family transcriptional regulator